ncbi:MAG: hypothetical protein EBU21_15065 [Proteobacteria bacterium]|nr:hypothetical protein [Pseudomonadota bacterium]NBT96132.1 hypothetical protein [Chloroflexota bacterium]
MLSGRISGIGLVVMRVHLLRERPVHFVADFLGVMFGGYAWEAIGEGILGTLLGAAVSLGVGAVCGVITGIVGGVFFGVLRALASAVRSMFQWPDPGRPIALMSQVLHTAVTSASHL